MFIHTTNQFIHEFATAEIDSIVFQRTQPPMALPRDTVWIRDTVWRTGVISHDGCKLNTPSWGESLGTVSFYTSQTWRVEQGIIRQFWSDAVTATACQKTTFRGSGWYVDWHTDYDFEVLHYFNTDCRSNPYFPGDFFSWCAVVRFADVLCPPEQGWRVPRESDFIFLDIALGGNGIVGMGESQRQLVMDNYINRWGGVFGGLTTSDGSLADHGYWGNYWSSTLIWTGGAGRLRIGGGTTNSVLRGAGFADRGQTLRCVRDFDPNQ